jgi:photosystem II stability/assembly factor-like uncharacterized protein
MRDLSSRRPWPALSLLALTLTAGPVAAQRPRPARPARHPSAAVRVGPAAPAYQGIWEPVSYPEDVELDEAFFTTPEEGWVTGMGTGGVVIHTADGGAHWDVQLGDPAGNQSRFESLQFVDRSTGFVVQRTGTDDHSLLRTLDGQTWRVTGTAPQHRAALRFVSATTGFTARNNEILRTDDAGRTWTPVFTCVLSVQSKGLTRNARCEVADFSFPTPDLGFAIGNSPDVRGLYSFRTQDGGHTWTAALALADDGQGIDGREGHLVFTDSQHGYSCVSGKLFGTSDGGVTWEGLAGAGCPGKPLVAFADAEIGWAFRYQTMTYTTDGGRRWVSREIPFPASGHGFSLPRRDRAYVVGDHGMVYRYRLVPVGAVPAGALAAPAMPGFPTVLGVQTDSLSDAVGDLQAELAKNAGTAPAGGSDSVSGIAVTPFVASCCAKRLGRLQLILDAVGGLLPAYTGKYRNLNLVAQGIRVASGLPDEANSLRSAVRDFGGAADQGSAVQALAALRGALDGFRAQVDTALQRSPASPPAGGGR